MHLTLTVLLWLGAALGLGAGGAPVGVWILLVAGVGIAVIAARSPLPALPPLSRAAGWCLLALLGLIAIQLINPSHRDGGPGMHLVPLAPMAGLPSTVDRSATIAALARGVLYALTFGLVWRGVPPARHRLLLGGLVLYGAVVALTGIAMRPTAPVTRQPMGPFGSENHFAACLNLLIPVALALTVEIHRRAARWWESRAFLPAAALGTMLAGAAVSASRAGACLAIVLPVAWALGEWRPPRLARLVLGATVALGVGFLMVFWGGLAGSWERDLAQRGLIWRGVLAMIQDWPVFGVGLGGFALAYPYYQPAALEGVCTAAHNDGLQVVAELGLVGAALLATVVVALLAPVRRTLRGRRMTGLSRALALALLGLGLHAAVDSPLRNPAIVTLAVALAAVWCRRLAASPESDPRRAEAL